MSTGSENTWNEPALEAVPWTTREVWRGVFFLGLWWVTVAVAAVSIAVLELDINPGVFIGLAEMALLIPVWWLTLRKYGIGWSALGLREFKSGNLGLGCGLMLLTFVFNIAYAALLDGFGLRVQEDLVPVFAELSSPWWFLLAGIVIAPIVEEIFFRGFVYAGLRTKYDWRKAALISSALFALTHLEITAFVPIFVLGWVFAFLYERSNSIMPAILMHIFTNGLSLGVAFLAASAELPT